MDSGASSVSASETMSARRGCRPIIAAIAAALPTGGASSESMTPARKAGIERRPASASAPAAGSATPIQSNASATRRGRNRAPRRPLRPAVSNEPSVSRKADNGAGRSPRSPGAATAGRARAKRRAAPARARRWRKERLSDHRAKLRRRTTAPPSRSAQEIGLARRGERGRRSAAAPRRPRDRRRGGFRGCSAVWPTWRGEESSMRWPGCKVATTRSGRGCSSNVATTAYSPFRCVKYSVPLSASKRDRFGGVGFQLLGVGGAACEATAAATGDKDDGGRCRRHERLLELCDERPRRMRLGVVDVSKARRGVRSRPKRGLTFR